MIIIHLKGGLGNQLFQYAFARSLSYNLNTELFLDISFFSHNEKRKHVIFGLNSFNIKGIIGNYGMSEKTAIGLKYSTESTIKVYTESFTENFPDDIFNYEILKDIDDLEVPAFFDGYFQKQNNNNKSMILTENFFKYNNDLIHEDLQYFLPLSENYEKLIKDMEKHDSIALHVRLGDYRNIPEFGLCSKEYYEKAINLLASKLEKPKFYIFSEDQEWVRNNLNIPFPVYHIYFNEKLNVSNRGYAELLKLMSYCDHFIIANSTFSWWGAFLSENKEKIIISPKPWFQDRSIIETDTIDNIKTINIYNEYDELLKKSKNVLYELNEENISIENFRLNIKDNKFILSNLSCESKLFLKNINQININNGAIINISLKTNCFNCLKIYYKTLEKDFCEENVLNLFYYENEKFNHSIILPQNVILNELMIKPYTIKNEAKNSIVIENILIKEIMTEKSRDIDNLYKENNYLKFKIFELEEELSILKHDLENDIQIKQSEYSKLVSSKDIEIQKLNDEISKLVSSKDIEIQKLNDEIENKNAELLFLKEKLLEKLEKH